MEEPSPIRSLPARYRLASARVLEYRILGPLEVLEDGRPIALAGPKQRAALVILLLSANRVVSIERFADDLYAGAPPVTAVTQVQRQVSELRKVIGPDTIETRSPGYVLHAEPAAVDLGRFESLTGEAAQALARGDAQAASDLYVESLDLWRGAPLAELTYDSFAQPAIGRLEEMRLAALEQRFDADLELGRHSDVIGELEALIWDHPLRERFRAQMMLALYRAGRQAEALDHYRRARQTLVDEFGIEPSESLRELERLILRQDPGLERAAGSAPRVDTERTILVVPSSVDRLGELLSVAEPLARLPGRTLLLSALVEDPEELQSVSAALEACRAGLSAPCRAAAFTSREPARDIVRLAGNYEVELAVLQASDALHQAVEHSPADVAVCHGAAVDWSTGRGVYVPFGGSENDWAALELGAWLASAAATTLRVVGTKADETRGRRDASRLLADASLAVQRTVGVAAEPLLVEADAAALAESVAEASVVVAGFPARWPHEGLGETRQAMVDASGIPVLLVHRGLRPGGLAPSETRTRFSWSLEP
jgi:DNA-binding SARP family transcriptional activator